MRTNRKHKDRLFRFIFEEKENLLQLYNAINGTNYSNTEDLEIVTLKDIIYMRMKNDISFLIDCQLNLFEHQSSDNPNMPLRGLLYLARQYEKYVKINHHNILFFIMEMNGEKRENCGNFPIVSPEIRKTVVWN